MDIDKLEAGRELDALVAEKVMGWEVYTSKWEVYTSKEDYIDKGTPHQQEWAANVSYPAYFWKGWATVVPYFSTDITAAWGIIDWLHKSSQLRCSLEQCCYEWEDEFPDGWQCIFHRESPELWVEGLAASDAPPSLSAALPSRPYPEKESGDGR